MSRAVQALVEVRFAADAATDDIRLEIEPDLGGYADFDVHLLLFPAVGAELRADFGSVRYGNTKTVGVPPGIIEINGGTTARLPKPPSENPTMRVMRASDASGADKSVSIAMDANGIIRANADCYAAISYSAYKTRAREIIYTPQMSGGLTTFGSIVAFYPPRSQTVYQVGAFDIENGNVEVELYRITSNAVTTNDGEFEKPTNPDGSYTGASLKIDMSSHLETERVHEIGYMDQRGRAWVRAIHVPIKEPFVGNAGYTPTKTCRVSPVPPDKFTKEQIAKASPQSGDPIVGPVDEGSPQIDSARLLTGSAEGTNALETLLKAESRLA